MPDAADIAFDAVVENAESVRLLLGAGPIKGGPFTTVRLDGAEQFRSALRAALADYVKRDSKQTPPPTKTEEDEAPARPLAITEVHRGSGRSIDKRGGKATGRQIADDLSEWDIIAKPRAAVAARGNHIMKTLVRHGYAVEEKTDDGLVFSLTGAGRRTLLTKEGPEVAPE